MMMALRIVIAVLYTVMYAVSAVVAAGAGHGTVLFLFPLVTWIFYLAAFIILNKFGPRTFYILMALHYTHLIIVTWSLVTHGLDPNDKKYWDSDPEVVVFTALLYLAGQAVTWGLFFTASRRHKISA